MKDATRKGTDAQPGLLSTERVRVGGLALELTYSCNQACRYCYNPVRSTFAPVGSGDRTEPETATLLARLTRLLRDWELGQVTLTGGEPLGHPALFPLLELLRERGVCRQIITNGTLVSEAMARRLAPYSLTAAQLTLNGPTPELHRAHVGRDSFQDVLVGARRLIAEGVPVTGCVVVTRRNAEHIAAIIEIWASLGVRRIALSRFSPAGVSLTRMHGWLPRRQDLVSAFTQAVPFAKGGIAVYVTVPVPACLFDTGEFAPIRFGQCAVGSFLQEFALGPDGALRLCTLHPGRLAGGRDVLDPAWDLRSVPTAAEVAHYRLRVPEFCRDCGAATTCLGGCGASALFCDDGSSRALDPLVEQYFNTLPESRLPIALPPERAAETPHDR